jgi:asparagine synthase (glutamine-hydrolysing)
MCGIAAIISKTKVTDPSAITNHLTRILNQMKHRGPDGTGLYVGDGMGLAMTRLAIVGGEAGMQPIWNEDKTVVVVCNGEIYNHQQLRSQLEGQGHTFSSQSDVEVIVHLYETYGEKCVQKLEGIFAFALWDTVKKQLLVARDKMGVKPLYYAETENYTIFSSEFRALLSFTDVNTTFDSRGFSAFHAFRFVPACDTLVKGIQKLAPGQCLTLRKNSLTVASYWSPQEVVRQPQPIRSRRERASVLRDRLLESVKSQATTDVQTGLLFSGGLDSTGLLAMHHHLFGQVPPTFTVSFDRPKQYVDASEYSELEYANQIAAVFEAKHTAECYSPSEVLQHLPSIVAALDEPIADPTAIPLWLACRLAKQSGVKVLYSGEGLDELFSGYKVYRKKYWLQALHLLPEGLRRIGSSGLNTLRLPGAGLMQHSLTSPAEWYQGVGGIFSSGEWTSILSEAALDKYRDTDPQAYVRHMMDQVNDKSVLTQMTHFDVCAWLPENTLVKSDKISMAHSIELRVPYLDSRVVEFALQAPDGDKLRFGKGKWLVRRALADFVPPLVLRRKKAGFPVPLTAWVFHEWRDFILSTLLDANACTHGLYNVKKIEQLMNSPTKAQGRAARQLWALLTLELWYRHVYAAAKPASRTTVGMVRQVGV